ncbi:hypothetical protein [Streptomyces xinghaiensis]|uniref:hypothetical protein n=1 Tax=Streptomyces xinghaiensis TaxID=1038928 RepID=UPI0002E0055C|nr:hypothetical protein [Streptomyces xinghaiensis]MZE79707.1 hypothetical protein [Streptomyces sp. SID5475]
MATDLSTVTGVRQTLAVVLPVRLAASPTWATGPIPFELSGRRTDAATRQTYFTPAAARALYGTPERPCRWHRFTDVRHEALHLRGIELLRTATARFPDHGLAVLHFDVGGPALLETLRAIGHRSTAVPDPLDGPLSPAVLLDGVAEPRGATAPFAIARPYTVAFLTPGAQHTAALRQEGRLPDTADRWLWYLASRSTDADFPTPLEHWPDRAGQALRISADWSALVLRHGAAFLGHRADSGDGDFYAFAQLHSRTVYLDALLLGSVQRDHIDELTDALSGVFDGPKLARRVSALERHIAAFRSTYWRQHLTAHGPANELLLSFQAQYRLAERFDEILAEAADYARLVQTQESQQIAGALGVLTILGLPVGTALGILQVLGAEGIASLAVALVAALAATALVLTTRYGRLVLSSLRGRDPGDSR